jgi:riboflavin synthase
MFTGIIEATGTLVRLSPQGGDLSLRIQSRGLDFSDVKLGDSIASNGVCLTVTDFGSDWFQADLSNETLTRTLFGHYKTGQLINLEKALLPTTRLGGHLVSGHVDGVATVSRVEKSGRAWQIFIKMPTELSQYIAEKGSITIDGVSLTVNELVADQFRLTIVPHTAEQTTLLLLAPGHQVHLEVDLLARYLERLLKGHQAPATQGVSLELLQQRGFL